MPTYRRGLQVSSVCICMSSRVAHNDMYTMTPKLPGPQASCSSQLILYYLRAYLGNVILIGSMADVDIS